MSVLIKSMEMPDSCFLCRFCRRQEYGEYVGEDTAWSCVASKKRITDGQDLIATFKHPDCPLVEAAEVRDAVSRQEAIEARRYTFGNDEFSLEAAYHDYKLVFDGITDDDSFQEADTGLILYYANEIIYALQEALEGKDTNVPTNDCISRQKAIDAFNCTDELIVSGEANAQNVMNYINKVIGKIKALPSAQPEPCEDAVSRRAVVSRIADLIVLELEGNTPTWNEVYRAVGELPSVQSEQRWIPCSERLPDEKDAGILKKLGTNRRSEYVLATVEVKGERMTVTACTYDSVWHWDKKYAFPTWKVVAWMPLPEPYRGEKE